MGRAWEISEKAISAAAVAVAATLCVAGCGGHSSSPSSSQPSDADQIRALMQREQNAFNNVDYYVFLDTLCAEQRSQAQSQTTWTDQDNASLRSYGPIEFTLTNIKVTGDTATASDSTKGQREPESRRTTDTANFKRESGAWKDCTQESPSG
jgi:hypothetical protein